MFRSWVKNRAGRAQARLAVVLVAIQSIPVTLWAQAEVKQPVSTSHETTFANIPAEVKAAFPAKHPPFAGVTFMHAANVLAMNLQVKDLVTKRDFAGLDQLAESYCTDKEVFASGDARLPVFHQMIENNARELLKAKDAAATNAAYRQFLADWTNARPQSATAWGERISAQLSYAWEARGTGFANTVKEEAFAEFYKRLEPISAWTAEAEQHELRDPSYYTAAIGAARALGESRDRVDTLVAAGAKLEPYPFRVFTAATSYYLPRWHGEDDDLPKLADRAIELTGQRYGNAIYAEIIWETQRYHGRSTFDDFTFSWDKFQRGYCDLAKQFPNMGLVAERFCKLACYTGRRELAHYLFSQHMGKEVNDDPWRGRSNYSYRPFWVRWSARPSDQIGKSIFEFSNNVQQVAWSADGRGLWFLTKEGLSQLSLADGQSQVVLPIEKAQRMEASADGKYLAISVINERGAELIAIPTQRPTEMLSLDLQAGSYGPIRFLGTGNALMSRPKKSQIRVWNLPETVVAKELPCEFGFFQEDMSPDGRYLASLSPGVKTGLLWDTTSNKIVHECRLSEPAVADGQPVHQGFVKFSPDGTRVAFAGETTLSIWDVATGKQLASANDALSVGTAARFTPDGRRLVTAANRRRVIEVTEKGQKRTVSQMAPSPVIVWDAETLAKVHEFPGHEETITGLAISPDGKRAATSSSDETIRVWDLPK